MMGRSDEPINRKAKACRRSLVVDRWSEECEQSSWQVKSKPSHHTHRRFLRAQKYPLNINVSRWQSRFGIWHISLSHTNKRGLQNKGIWICATWLKSLVSSSAAAQTPAFVRHMRISASAAGMKSAFDESNSRILMRCLTVHGLIPEGEVEGEERRGKEKTVEDRRGEERREGAGWEGCRGAEGWRKAEQTGVRGYML